MIVVLTALALSGGCGNGGSSAGQAREATRAAVNLDELDHGPWRAVIRPERVDPILVDHCGNPRTGGRMPSDGLIAGSVSRVLQYRPGPFPENGLGFGEVRVAVSQYRDESTAHAAAASPDLLRLTRCVISALRTKWFPLQSYDERTAVAETGVPLAAVSFESGITSNEDGDTSLRTISVRFPEEMLGGFDNYHDVAESVGRSGLLVATAVVASNSQQGDPAATRALARRLASRALERAASRAG